MVSQKTYMMFLFSINELYVDGTAPETTEEKIFALIFVTVFSVLVFSLLFETVEKDGETTERQIRFTHNPSAPDDVFEGVYTNTIYQPKEMAVMNLGHGRAGHFPDYSFARYRYLPAWDDYEEIIKDNPSDYMNAFCQMIYALKVIRGERDCFEKEHYEKESVSRWAETIDAILRKRQLNANDDWREFGRSLSGQYIEAFDLDKYTDEYIRAEKDKKDDTYLGQFFIAALKQKSMVTGRIFRSGNPLAGVTVDYKGKGFRGIREIIYYFTMARYMVGGNLLLFKGVIFLDFGGLTLSLTDVPSGYVILCVTFFNRPETAVYVYASGLVYSAILRVITAFRRTAVVSIQ